MRTRLPVILVLGGLLVCAVPAPAADPKPTPEQLEFFEKKVRPVLASHCFQCHSSGKKRSGGLLVDSRAALLKGGDTGPALDPGHPEKSLLVTAIGYKELPKMPKRSKLPDEQIADLTAWVKMGAPWPAGDKPTTVVGPKAFDLEERKKHWSFQPLVKAPPPSVKDKDWPHNDVDRFILAALETKGLHPAAPADKRTWLRRVTYDLIGLPPTPDEIDAFLKDESPTAYDKVVDRLLASPHYGERWGRHWLDLVRFAETSGHEFDFEIPHAYEYRDYIIRAFNADVPYDQLVREHLAGDLLPKPRRHPTEGFNESVLGTGFWFLGESKHSPVELRQDGADRRDNMIDVFSKTFLGLTVACARCHDHKFDAITQKDYYSLVSYLQSSRCDHAFLDAPEKIDIPARKMRELRTEANKLAVAQSAKVLSERLDKLSAALLDRKSDKYAAFRKALAAIDGKKANDSFALWRALTDGEGIDKPEVFASRRKALLERPQFVDQTKRFDDFERDGYKNWFTTGAAFGDGPSDSSDAVLQPDAAVPIKSLVGRGIAHSGLVSNKLQGSLRSRTFTIEKKFIYYRAAGRGAKVNLIIDGFQNIRDPIYGGLTFGINHGEAFVWHKQDVSMWVGLKAYIEVLDDGNGYAGLDRVVFSDGGAPPDRPNCYLLSLLQDPAVKSAEILARKLQAALIDLVAVWRESKLDKFKDSADSVAVLNALLSSEALAALPSATAEKPVSDRGKLADLLQQIRDIETKLPAPRRGLAMADGDGDTDYVYIRGSYKDHGEDAPRRFLEALAGAEQPVPAKGSGRLELAEKLLDESNPLTARVMVNRLWLHHFGEGLVRSPDNFGLLGQPPTHPELLDWLAREFRQHHWSIKEMHRLLVLSSTYRMGSRSDAKSDETDPENHLLHRMPIRRLEAETVRDAMLAVSGRLDPRLYGPGPPPYLTPFMVGRGRPGASGPLDGDGRRSVYLNVRRNFLNPMFLAFDYPVPFTTIGKRTVSNVPAQALTLLNNPFVIQQAQLWSKRVLAEPNLQPAERITRMYVTAFGRPPTAAELKDAQDFLADQAKEYGKADDPHAWTDLCHVLFNVKEFIFLN